MLLTLPTCCGWSHITYIACTNVLVDLIPHTDHVSGVKAIAMARGTSRVRDDGDLSTLEGDGQGAATCGHSISTHSWGCDVMVESRKLYKTE